MNKTAVSLMPAGEGRNAPSLPPDWIGEIVGALTDPLIVWQSPWMDTLPEWIHKELPLHRLAYQMQCSTGLASWDECTDLEALAYMYPRTLEDTLSHEWVNIYCYLATVARPFGGCDLPAGMRHEKITDYEMGMLQKLKRWIKEKQIEVRKRRARGEKVARTTEKVVPAKYEQMGLGV